MSLINSQEHFNFSCYTSHISVYLKEHLIADEDKDKDMQIGFPTDVKHVAHIGSDGPETNMPSWVWFVRTFILILPTVYIHHW